MGGLAFKTKQVCDLLDAFGKDVIIIETIGVGQAELDVAKAAHTTLVVLVPESGDGIQAMKAGLMEIGDLFIVNKSDREGADRMVVEIEMMLSLRPQNDDWPPKVFRTVASEGEGIDILNENIREHWSYLENHHLLHKLREKNIRAEIFENVEYKLIQSLWNDNGIKKIINDVVSRVTAGAISPFEASDELLRYYRKKKS